MRRAALPTIFCIGALLLALCLPPGAVAQQALPSYPGGPGSRVVPPDSYLLNFQNVYDGQYADALKGFMREGRSGVRTAESRWIDSVCYHAMSGECCYQLGRMQDALDHFESALKLYLAFSDWMIRVRFNDFVLQPAVAGTFRAPPWGQSTRGARVGQFPGRGDHIQVGQLDASQILRQGGGVVQRATAYPIRASEIVRSTALAMRRWRELVGPSGKHLQLAKELERALNSRPCPPNHWSECWIDLELGLAQLLVGKDDQAKSSLQRSLLAGGEYDHPLTGIALLELGKLALAAGEHDTAAGLFVEASYAAFNYPEPVSDTVDAVTIEEALRLGLTTHLLVNRPGLYPPLQAASAWAKSKGYRQLYLSTLAMTAENLTAQGEAPQAASLYSQARGAASRSDLLNSRTGARIQYAHSAALYESGELAGADSALRSALAFQAKGSVRVFRLTLLDRMFGDGRINARLAGDLYRLMLPEPLGIDWQSDALESLTMLMTPHPGSFDNWFEVTLARQDHAAAIEVADLARQHEYLSTQTLGGRVTALRWVLEAPTEALGAQAQLDRQNLLQRYPRYQQLSQEAREISNALRQSPLVTEDPQQRKEQAAQLRELTARVQAQEVLLHAIAASREPYRLMFPQLRTLAQIQAGLAEGQGLWTFHATRGNVYSALVTSDNVQLWKLGSPAGLQKRVAAFLKDIGNVDANRPLTKAQLNDEAWKISGQKLLTDLLAKSEIELPGSLEELVIVPDGPLWYLPFEALQISEGDESVALIDRVRLRYAPFSSLAVADARGRKTVAQTACVLGKLSPRGEATAVQNAFDEMTRSVSGAVPLPTELPAAAAIYGSLFDRLLVLDDLDPLGAGPFDWQPVATSKGPLASPLSEWAALPFAGPDEVILPGFHTAAETALKKQSAGTSGQEVFLSVCELLASGTRTVLLSRWRTGGSTAFELVREFAQELGTTSPAEAWQRSILLVQESPLNLEGEPRLDKGAFVDPPSASHPFFWAGYMLIDPGMPGESAEEDPTADPPDPAADPADDPATDPDPPADSNIPADADLPADTSDSDPDADLE
jgi:tetratricopeptide (TPR) repeat protein/CHAT domain-containing protein